MFKRITIIVALAAFLSVDAKAQQHRNRNGGALLGGLAGAAIGAAIGDKGDNETEGALIGGALGAIAGGSMGNQKDQWNAHNRRYHSQRRYRTRRPTTGQQYGPYQQYHQPYFRPQNMRQTPVYAPSQPGQKSLSPQDVLNMVRSGWKESMIIQQVRVRGMQQALTITDVIHLHKLGISESVLVAMQEASPVIVDEKTTTSPEQLPLPAPPTNSSSGAQQTPYGSSVLSRSGN